MFETGAAQLIEILLKLHGQIQKEAIFLIKGNVWQTA